MSMFTPAGERGPSPTRLTRAGRLVVTALLLLLVAAGAFTAWRYVGGDGDGKGDGDAKAGPGASDGASSTNGATPTPGSSCTKPAPGKKPVPAAKVRVNVYNSTQRNGLAAGVAEQLARRGFRVTEVANDPLGRTVSGAAEIRHSKAGAAAARTVAAHVGVVVAAPDTRRGASVDLVLGEGFTRLQPSKRAAATLSTPSTARPGC